MSMGKKIKLRRCTAFTIAFALIVSLCFSNVPNTLKKVYAADNCQIEVSPENDGHVELQDDYTIGYLDEDKNCIATYKFFADEQPISFYKSTDELDGGGFKDTYIAEGLSSDAEITIEISAQGDDSELLYEGVAVDNDSTYEFDGENSVLYFELVEMGNGEPEPNPDQQNTFTVEFDADDDGSIAYDDNDHVLKYTVGAETYDLYLLSGLDKISLTKEARELPEGGWHDFYVATGLDKDKSLQIMSPNFKLDKAVIYYQGEGQGMWQSEENPDDNWYSIDYSQENNNFFSFRIERIDQGGNNPPPEVDTLVDFEGACWDIEENIVTAEVEGKDISNDPVNIGSYEVISIEGYDKYSMEIIIFDRNNNEHRVKLQDDGTLCLADANMPLGEGEDLIFTVRGRTGPDDDYVPRPEGNTEATYNISADPGCTYNDAWIEINGYPLYEGEGPIPATGTVNYYYDPEENDGKVTFSFGTLFIFKFTGTIKINNDEFVVDQLLDYADRTNWLDHYDHQITGFKVEVDKADVYDIKVNTEELEGEHIWIGNFLWTSNENEPARDLIIEKSKLEVLKVVYDYDGIETTVIGNDLFEDPHIEYNPWGETSSLVVPEGAECTVRLTPEYGYQVVSFGVNNENIVTGDNISEFTFPIHKGNFHLGAQVIETEDIKNIETENVKHGGIVFGEGEFDSGTAMLTVKDADIDQNKIEEFEGQLEEFEGQLEGYEIADFFDIKVDNIYYKGSEDDFWAVPRHELNNEATLFLDLAIDISGKDVKIIHNIGDGNEYEVIDAEIIAEGDDENLISFPANSFSTYAIAIKNSENEGDPEGNALYIISDGNVILSFTSEQGHEFNLTAKDILTMTDEELAALGVSREEYEKILSVIKLNLSGYGDLIHLYNIELVQDQSFNYSDGVDIRIKMTDEMKKYNSFKIIYVDNDDNFKIKDIIELKVEGDYLVGKLPHLSVYALVGTNTTAALDDKKTTVKDLDAASPQTGDSTLTITLTLMALSLLGILFIKKKKEEEN